MRDSKKVTVAWILGMLLMNTTTVPVSMAASPARQNLGTVRMLDIGIATSSAIPLVAHHRGFLKAEGLEATRTDVGSGPAAVAALLRDDADVVLTASATIAVAYAKGAKELLVIGTYNKGFPTQLIVRKNWLAPRNVSPASPLAARVKALSGIKMAAVGTGTGQDRFARYLLEQGGLNPGKDVTLSAFGGPDLSLAAFQEGRVESLIASDPWATQAVASGESVILVTGEDYPLFKGYPALVYVVKRSAFGAKRQFFNAFCRGIVNAGRFIVERPSEARAVVLAQFPKIAPNIFDTSWSASLDKSIGAVYLAAQDATVSPAELKKVLDFSNLKDLNAAELVDNSCLSPARR